MSVKEKIEVMQGYLDEKTIQSRSKCHIEGWHDIDNPTWNWSDRNYRIKPEPKVIYVNEYHHGESAYRSEDAAERNASENVERMAVKYIEVLED